MTEYGRMGAWEHLPLPNATEAGVAPQDGVYPDRGTWTKARYEEAVGLSVPATPGHDYPPRNYARLAYILFSSELSSGKTLQVGTPHGKLVFNAEGYRFYN